MMLDGSSGEISSIAPADAGSGLATDTPAGQEAPTAPTIEEAPPAVTESATPPT
jgi:hypothetical protein